MNEPILFGFAIIAIFVSWRTIVRKTALDHYRDELFDLREKVRKHYLDHGYGLEHKTYAELRSLLNSQIRFLDSASFTRLIICEIEMDQNKELRDSIREDLEKRFYTKSDDLAEFIKQVRREAYAHTTGYVLHASIVASAVVYSLLPVGLFCAIAHHSFKLSKKIFDEAVMKVPQRTISMDVVEGFSELKVA